MADPKILISVRRIRNWTPGGMKDYLKHIILSKHADLCTHRILLCHIRLKTTFSFNSFRMNEAENQWQSYKFICCLLVLSHADFQLRAVTDFILPLIPNNWWSPSVYQSLHPVWGHPPVFTSQSCCLLSFKSPHLVKSHSRGTGEANEWWAGMQSWWFQIQRERQKWGSKPFKKQWPPTPHTHLLPPLLVSQAPLILSSGIQKAPSSDAHLLSSLSLMGCEAQLLWGSLSLSYIVITLPPTSEVGGWNDMG